MTRRSANRFQRLMIRTAALLGAVAYGTAWSMDGAESGLNAWAVFGGIALVLAVGLYLQSIRRRIA